MLENSKEELRTLVLLEFTKKLIIERNPTIFLKKINKPRTQKEKLLEKIESKIPELRKAPIIKQRPRIISRQRLKVPETRLPPQFAYLKPNPTQSIKLNLGKLEPLIQDPSIKIIEVNGANQQVIVKGGMGTMPTNTLLTEEDIDNILQEFSNKSRIPIGEGVTKIALGNYTLSAIISPEAGSRFILKKIPLMPPTPRIQRK